MSPSDSQSSAISWICLRSEVEALPDTHPQLLDVALSELSVPAEQVQSYLSALLLDVNGWASWCAYRRFQAAPRASAWRGAYFSTIIAAKKIAKQALVRQLVENEWLHLFRLDGSGVEQRRGTDWHAVRL